ncbi:hypothetical protein AKO1_015600 [Acrasis kona]|uniref:Uncharacterized protein n=1 Tax=Acrasis kona TaxID=1008807 RepID=A0AAW2ZGC4_9EUKA
MTDLIPASSYLNTLSPERRSILCGHMIRYDNEQYDKNKDNIRPARIEIDKNLGIDELKRIIKLKTKPELKTWDEWDRIYKSHVPVFTTANYLAVQSRLRLPNEQTEEKRRELREYIIKNGF